jgi:hypothetical protein
MFIALGGQIGQNKENEKTRKRKKCGHRHSDLIELNRVDVRNRPQGKWPCGDAQSAQKARRRTP